MDLREILREHGVTYTDGHVENAMKEAIRQALELACKANNSRLFNYPTIEDFEDGYNQCVKDSNKDIMSIMDEL